MISYDFGRKRVGWDAYPTIAGEFLFLLSFSGRQQPLPSPFLSIGAGLSSHLSLWLTLSLSPTPASTVLLSAVSPTAARNHGWSALTVLAHSGGRRLLWHFSPLPPTFYLIARRPSLSIARENHAITRCQRQIP